MFNHKSVLENANTLNISYSFTLPDYILCTLNLFSNSLLVTKYLYATGAALRIAAVILFERYEQKDKSGKPDRRERPNKK